MEAHALDACVLVDPVNVRYATGARNMQVFHLRNPVRYLFLPLDGPVVLHEFPGCMHLAEGLETIDEIRPSITASYVAAGPAVAETELAWASQVAQLVRAHCGARARVGVERVNAGAALALAAEGFDVADAQAPVERARAVKSAEELRCIRASIAATEAGVARMRAALAPGLSENELWSILHQSVIALGGEYVETRLLSSGPRTNPWFQETGERRIEPGELVALDTDVVGCHGYYCDFSRTFHAGPGEPTAAPARALPARARAGAHEPRAAAAGALVPRVLRAGVDDPRPVRREPLLPLRARLRHDRRVPVPLPPHGLRRLRLRRRRRAGHDDLRRELHRRGGRRARASSSSSRS